MRQINSNQQRPLGHFSFSMGIYGVILVVSGLIPILYLVAQLARIAKVPKVLFLLLFGLFLRYLADYYGFKFDAINQVMPMVGVIGLALIVLEGGLELDLNRDKLGLVIKALISASGVLLLTTGLLVGILYYWFPQRHWSTLLLNAIPLATVSSAIAIPSIRRLDNFSRESLIYETTFADILGIMLFQLMSIGGSPNFIEFISFGLNSVLTIFISVVVSLLLIFILPKTGHNLKFFLILSILVFLFALGKVLHLPSLLLLLIFGLLINNIKTLGTLINQFSEKSFKALMDEIVPQFKTISFELSFVVRTFFFFLFGYSIVFTDLLVADVWIKSIVLVLIFIIGRAIVILPLYGRKLHLSNAMIVPRGLVTVILFMNLPPQIKLLSDQWIATVVLTAVVFMVLGLIVAPKVTEENSFTH